jgi:hypothetical protein
MQTLGKDVFSDFWAFCQAYDEQTEAYLHLMGSFRELMDEYQKAEYARYVYRSYQAAIDKDDYEELWDIIGTVVLDSQE